jgi:hypothetical protein
MSGILVHTIEETILIIIALHLISDELFKIILINNLPL